ncbi:MAG TPA: hypothetical protein PLX17_12565, partial [Chitinophagaceae bacterium]|nr:hypothetical protein [Chitinophagaceae bacterium]
PTPISSHVATGFEERSVSSFVIADAKLTSLFSKQYFCCTKDLYYHGPDEHCNMNISPSWGLSILINNH